MSLGAISPCVGTAYCSVCPSGTMVDVQNQFCQNCPSGKSTSYNMRMNEISRELCVRVFAESRCVYLPVLILGKYQNMTGEVDCFECDSGTYANMAGLSLCIPCDPGTSTNAMQALVCEVCQPGTF